MVPGPPQCGGRPPCGSCHPGSHRVPSRIVAVVPCPHKLTLSKIDVQTTILLPVSTLRYCRDAERDVAGCLCAVRRLPSTDMGSCFHLEHGWPQQIERTCELLEIESPGGRRENSRTCLYATEDDRTWNTTRPPSVFIGFHTSTILIRLRMTLRVCDHFLRKKPGTGGVCFAWKRVSN